jgi:hypothetical protein
LNIKGSLAFVSLIWSTWPAVLRTATVGASKIPPDNQRTHGIVAWADIVLGKLPNQAALGVGGRDNRVGYLTQ